MDVFASFRRLGVDSLHTRESKSWNLHRLESPILILILLSIFAIAPLFHPMYFWGAHDARHSVYFLVEFDRSIQDSILYPRWAPDFTFGYGYPIFNIYAPLAYYLGEAFHLLGLDFVESVKVVFGLSFVLSGLTMYLFARGFFGSRGALLASVVYVYVPYRIVDVYVRGALAESLAFVFFPLVLWAFRRVALDHQARHVVVASLSLAGFILTSNTMAMLFMPLLVGYCLWTIVAEKSGSIKGAASACGWTVAAGMLALGLSAIFWLPMVAENQYVRADQWTTAYYDYKSHFVYLYQLFSPLWGYGISKSGPGDEMPFQLGVVSVSLALLGLWLRGVEGGGLRMKIRPYILWNEGRKGEKEKREKGEDVSTHHPPPSILHSSVWPQSIFFLVATVAAIFLMLPVSAGLWEVFRIAVFVQFPWRLLAITTLSLSFLSGSAVVGDRWSLGSFAALASLLIAVVLGSYAYLSPQFIEPAEGPVSLGGLMRFQQSSGELVGLTKWNQEKPKDSPLMPLYVAGQPITSKVVPDSVPSGASVEAIRRTTTLDEVRVKSPSDVQLTFYTQAYPGWKAYVDGVPADLAPTGKLGLISVKVPSGEHVVLLRFETTAPRTIGGLLSGLSVALIAVWGVRRVLQQRAGR